MPTEDPWNDPLIEELHQIRERHGRKFDYDVDKIYEDLIKQENERIKEGVNFTTREKGDSVKIAS